MNAVILFLNEHKSANTEAMKSIKVQAHFFT